MAFGEAWHKIPHSVVRAVDVLDLMGLVLPVDMRGKFGKCHASGSIIQPAFPARSLVSLRDGLARSLRFGMLAGVVCPVRDGGCP